jgi:hypothetical protein
MTIVLSLLVAIVAITVLYLYALHEEDLALMRDKAKYLAEIDHSVPAWNRQPLYDWEKEGDFDRG